MKRVIIILAVIIIAVICFSYCYVNIRPRTLDLSDATDCVLTFKSLKNDKPDKTHVYTLKTEDVEAICGIIDGAHMKYDIFDHDYNQCLQLDFSIDGKILSIAFHGMKDFDISIAGTNLYSTDITKQDMDEVIDILSKYHPDIAACMY